MSKRPEKTLKRGSLYAAIRCCDCFSELVKKYLKRSDQGKVILLYNKLYSVLCLNRLENISNMDPTATPNLKGQPGMAEVNEAYRIENGDEVKMIRNSWDDSNKESQMSNSHRPAMVTETATEELPRDASWEAMQKSQRIAGNEARLKATSQNPENCCVIEVSEGAYDNRLFKICKQF